MRTRGIAFISLRRRFWFSTRIVVLDTESKAAFDRLHDAFVARFQPQDQVAQSLIEEIVAAIWRLRRISVREHRTVQDATASQDPDSHDDIGRLTAAIDSVASVSH
jgi:hypothetical protein